MPQSGLLVRKPADQLSRAIGFCTIGTSRWVSSGHRLLKTGVMKKSVSRIRNLNMHAVGDITRERLADISCDEPDLNRFADTKNPAVIRSGRVFEI